MPRFEGILSYRDGRQVPVVLEMANLTKPLAAAIFVSPQDGAAPFDLVFTPAQAPALRMQVIMVCGKLRRLVEEFPEAAAEAEALCQKLRETVVLKRSVPC